MQLVDTCWNQRHPWRRWYKPQDTLTIAIKCHSQSYGSMRHDPLILRTDVPFASSLTDNPYLWWNESSSCHFALSCDAIVTVSASVPVAVPQPAPCPILPVQGPWPLICRLLRKLLRKRKKAHVLEFLANIIFKRDNNMHSRVCRRICEYVFNIKCNAHGIIKGHAWPISQETRCWLQFRNGVMVWHTAQLTVNKMTAEICIGHTHSRIKGCWLSFNATHLMWEDVLPCFRLLIYTVLTSDVEWCTQ